MLGDPAGEEGGPGLTLLSPVLCSSPLLGEPQALTVRPRDAAPRAPRPWDTSGNVRGTGWLP